MRNDELDAARLSFLQTEFFTNTGARKALATYRRLKARPDALSSLLRNHADEGIYDPDEIRKRDEFDDLMTYYSIRELAAIASYVGVNEGDPTLAAARELLSDSSVIPYYEKYYPLLLPRLLRQRLAGQSRLALEESVRHDAVVEDLLAMTRTAAKDEALDTFLWYLDDGWVGQESLSDVIGDVFARPERLVESLGTPYDSEQDDNGVVGFARFLGICARHDAMLQMIEPPIMRAALWHLNGYWYDILRDRLRPVVRKAQAAAREWQERDEGDPLPDFEAVVSRVTDPKVGQPLEAVARAQA